MIGRIVAVFGVLAAAPAWAAPALPFCVVDRIAILTRSAPAVALGAQFQQRRQGLQSIYDTTLRTIESDARMLASLKSSLPPAVAKARDGEIERRRQVLARDTGQANQQLQGFNDALKQRMLDDARPIIREEAAARGCAAVLPADGVLVVVDDRIDLTAAVLAKLATVPLPSSPSR